MVSIIIPTYNSDSFVKGCLENLRAIPRDSYEIIIVDGGSTDLTHQYVTVEQVHLSLNFKLNSGDRGVYDAMNKGISLSKGEWLYFMGADDRILPDGFNKAVQMLDTIECDILYGNVTAEHIDGDYKRNFDFKRLLNQNICHQGIFYRKSVFKNVGRYNLRYKYWADYEFNLRCFVKSSIRWLYIPVNIAYHAPGGLSSSIKRDASFDEDLIKNINNAIDQPFFIKVKFLCYLYAFCFENHGFYISIRRFNYCWKRHFFANIISFSFATLTHVFNSLRRR